MSRRKLSAVRREEPRAASVRMRVVDAAHGSRERIHAVALELFARYGYEAVSLQQIADEVGLHKSTLFHHYPSKLALMDEVIDTTIDQVLALLRPLLDSEARLEDFYGGVDRLVDHFSDQPAAARLLLATMVAPNDSDLRRAGSAARVLEFYVSLATWLERARKQGVVRALNIRQAIPNLVGLVLYYPATAQDLADLVGPEPFSARAREVRKRELRVVLAGLLEPRA